MRRNFLKFVTEDIDTLFPPKEYYRLIAHPPSDTIDAVPIRINQLQRGGRGRGTNGNKGKEVGEIEEKVDNDEVALTFGEENKIKNNKNSYQNIIENDSYYNKKECQNENTNENENKKEIIYPKKIVVAVGPEGGWEDEEVLVLISRGFSLVSLGPRILRTDMAVSVLLGLAHDWTDNIE